MWTNFQSSFTSWFARKFSMYTQRLPSHLRYVATLPCENRKSEYVTDFDNASSTNCWHVPDIEWLTNILKFVRRRLEYTDFTRLDLNIVASCWFFNHDYFRTVFVLSIRYSSRVVHIQVKSIVKYFCGRLL